jgi:1,2-diacylglycerol 3-alpha-glucosyltransferase
MVDPVLHRVGALGGRGVLADASPEPFATSIGGLLAAPDRARRLGAEAAAQAARHTPAEYAAAMGLVYRYSRAGVAVG